MANTKKTPNVPKPPVKKTAPRPGNPNNPPKYEKEGPAKSLQYIQGLTGKELNMMTADEIKEVYRSSARLANRKIKRLEDAKVDGEVGRLTLFSQLYQSRVRDGRALHWGLTGYEERTMPDGSKVKVRVNLKKSRNEMIREIMDMKSVLDESKKTASVSGTKASKKKIEDLIGRNKSAEDLAKFWKAYREYERQSEVKSMNAGSPQIIAAFASVKDTDVEKTLQSEYESFYLGREKRYSPKGDSRTVLTPEQAKLDAKRRLLWIRINALAEKADLRESQMRSEAAKIKPGTTVNGATFSELFAEPEFEEWVYDDD